MISCSSLVCAAVLAGAAGLASGPALAADWAVDAGASKLSFSGTQNGEAFSGKFARFAGTVTFDPAKPEADTQRDEALPQPEWFDAKKFPQAHFVASGFKAKGGDAYEADGQLSIRDIAQPVTLPFTLTITGDTAHAKGRAELVRTKFGVGQGPWSSGQWVALEVGVDVDLVAKKAGG